MAQALYEVYKNGGVDYVNVELSDYMPKSGFGDAPWKWSTVIPAGKSKGVHAIKHAHYVALIDVVDTMSTIQDDFGASITITSGYRIADSDSDHSKGRALDIWCSTPKEKKRLWDLIYTGNYKWRQLIWEDQLQSPKPANHGKYPDYPGIIHFSYAAKDNKKQVLYTTGNGDKKAGWPATTFPGSYAAGSVTSASPEGGVFSSSSDDGEVKEGDELNKEKSDDLLRANSLVGEYAKTLEQVDVALQNLEKGDVDVTWGSKMEGEPSNWISLKQYLLYLATRFVPQGIYPFVELIPANKDSLENKDWDRDGEVILDVNNNVVDKGAETDVNKQFEQASILRAKNKSGIDASNKASQTADLWSLDPFNEAYSEMGVYSKSGQEIYNRRAVGVRVYGQLVLSPEHGTDTPSKPGAIGFTELNIQAGSQCDKGIALISMKLVDLQGNKFTDLSSPWSFIYDARPGGVGGDFYFRYGWQIRVPDPNDRTDTAAVNFWNHQGWLLFSDDVRKFIAGQISSAKPYITLTQALNKVTSSERQNAGKYSLFDEGTEIMENNNSITVARTNLNPQNYIKLAILNPELEVDNNGAVTATLNFRTVGALAATVPLAYAANTKKATIASEGIMTLGDLIILVMTDFAQFEYQSINDPNTKQIQADYINQYLGGLAMEKERDFSNMVMIVGLGENVGEVHPDDIYLNISSDLISEVQNATDKDSIQLIGWMSEVLQEAGMEINSVATGSGAGINSAWVISIGTDFNQEFWLPKERKTLEEPSSYTDAIQLMINEQDVMSFRFQGTLVENIKVEKTDAPNALKIATDYAIADFLSVMDAQDKNSEQGFNKPASVADRRRNLNILFAQLQNVTVTSICHPWMGPGKDFFVKGMGFWDGRYKALRITHRLTADGKFITETGGARMIVPSKKDTDEGKKSNAAANGNTNQTQAVDEQNKSTSDNVKKADDGTANGVQKANPQDEKGFINKTKSSLKQGAGQLKTAITWESAFDPAYYLNKYNDILYKKETLLKFCDQLYNAHGTVNDDEDLIYQIYKDVKNVTTASYMAQLFWENYSSLKGDAGSSLKEFLQSFLSPEEFQKVVDQLKKHLVGDPEKPPATSIVKGATASITSAATSTVTSATGNGSDKAVAKIIEIKDNISPDGKISGVTDAVSKGNNQLKELDKILLNVKTTLNG